MYCVRFKDDAKCMMHIDDVARATTISAQRLRQMSTEGHFDRPVDAYWDLYYLLPLIVNYLKGTGQKERQRLQRAKADIAEIKAQEAKGGLVTVEDVERQWVEAVTRFKQRMFSIPSRAATTLAAETDPVVIQEKLNTLIEQACLELFRMKTEEEYEDDNDEFVDADDAGYEDPSAADEDDWDNSSEPDEADAVGAEGVSPAAAPDRQSVGRRKSRALQ